MTFYAQRMLPTLLKKATIHQVTTMLAISKNVLFPGHNQLLTTGTDVASMVITWWILALLRSVPTFGIMPLQPNSDDFQNLFKTAFMNPK